MLEGPEFVSSANGSGEDQLVLTFLQYDLKTSYRRNQSLQCEQYGLRVLVLLVRLEISDFLLKVSFDPNLSRASSTPTYLAHLLHRALLLLQSV